MAFLESSSAAFSTFGSIVVVAALSTTKTAF